jgi:hypothetical protein
MVSFGHGFHAILRLPELNIRVPERALPQEPPGRNQSLLQHGGFNCFCLSIP